MQTRALALGARAGMGAAALERGGVGRQVEVRPGASARPAGPPAGAWPAVDTGPGGAAAARPRRADAGSLEAALCPGECPSGARAHQRALGGQSAGADGALVPEAVGLPPATAVAADLRAKAGGGPPVAGQR